MKAVAAPTVRVINGQTVKTKGRGALVVQGVTRTHLWRSGLSSVFAEWMLWLMITRTPLKVAASAATLMGRY